MTWPSLPRREASWSWSVGPRRSGRRCASLTFSSPALRLLIPDRSQAAAKVAQLAGTTLGNLTGVKEDTPELEGASPPLLPPVVASHANLARRRTAPEPNPRKKNQKNDENDDRGDKNTDSQFASHLKAATGASSFSRNKSLKQQRQYLPAFASREALLKVIRENQGAFPSFPSLSRAELG